MNDNRIVRVTSDRTHKLILYVAKLTSSSYQQVFTEYLLYIEEGHLFGDMTHHILIERVLMKLKRNS